MLPSRKHSIALVVQRSRRQVSMKPANRSFLWLLIGSITVQLLEIGGFQRSTLLHQITTGATSAGSAFPGESRNTDESDFRIWLQITVSLEYDQHLLPHLLDHYLGLGIDPNYILLSLHHRSANASKFFGPAEVELRRRFGVRYFHRWTGDYDSNRLWEARQAHRAMFDIRPCDWIVKSDADELPAIPGGNLPEFLASVGDQGYDVVFGTFNDRVTIDGSLVDISPAPSLHEQFPLTCNVTAEIAIANTRKAIAFRGYHKENRGGHELMETSRQEYDLRKKKGYDHCGFPLLLKIDHFKWTSQAAQKILVRSKHYQEIGMGHYKQSARLVDHILENMGLNVKAMNCSLQADGAGPDYRHLYSDGQTCRTPGQVVCPGNYPKSGPSVGTHWILQKSLRSQWDQIEHTAKYDFAFTGRRAASAAQNAVSLAVIADIDQWHRLLLLIERWNGPVSVAIYIPKKDDIVRLESLWSRWRPRLETTDFHILMDKTPSWGYPHNTLRELSLSNVRTNYFLTLDVDVLPTINASEALRNRIILDHELFHELNNKTLMAIPTFHRMLNASEAVNESNCFQMAANYLPSNTTEARRGYEMEILEPFKATRFEHSLTSGLFYTSDWLSPIEQPRARDRSFTKVEFRSGLAVFVLGSKKDIDVPRYWQAFRGHGFGHNTWLLEAHLQGFKFGVLKDFFVTHLTQADEDLRGSRKLSLQEEKSIRKYLEAFQNKQ